MSIFDVTNLVRTLDSEDFRVLKGIELGMRRFKYVTLEQIAFYARFNRDKTQFRLDKLHKLGILQRNSDVGYIGYQLISESYDILALDTLAKQDVLSSMGKILARGKESDVFYGLTNDNQEVAVKIHRIGQTSFRQVKKLRGYSKGRKHMSWLYMSRLSAEREFEALQRVEPLNIGIPKPIAQNRHMVVMTLISGRQLSTVNALEDPQRIFNEILRQITLLYSEAKLIHCDLSEYNIIIGPGEEERDVIIIDYPQWVPTDHPNAHSYFERDLNNVNNFFFKRFQLSFNVPEFMENLKSSTT